MPDIFYAARHRYEKNRRDAAGLNVKQAIQEAPHGAQEPGLAICILGRPVLVLPPDEALRLAKDIADQLTRMQPAT